MLRPIRNSLISIGLLGPYALAHAEPTVADVNVAIQAGQYAKAEQLIKEVAPNHPASPRVHYMMAQALSHMPGRDDEARQEFQAAMNLNPQLPFADATDVNALQQRLRPQAEPPGPQEAAPQMVQPRISPPPQPQEPLPPSMKAPPFVPHLQPPAMSVFDKVLSTLQENQIASLAGLGVVVALVIGVSLFFRKKKGDGEPKKNGKKLWRRREPVSPVDGLEREHVAPGDGLEREAEQFDYSNGSPDHRDRTDHRETPAVASQWATAHHDDEHEDFART